MMFVDNPVLLSAVCSFRARLAATPSSFFSFFFNISFTRGGGGGGFLQYSSPLSHNLYLVHHFGIGRPMSCYEIIFSVMRHK